MARYLEDWERAWETITDRGGNDDGTSNGKVPTSPFGLASERNVTDSLVGIQKL